MGKPTRPSEAITYEQAAAYEASRTKWIKVHGHITHIFELAQIFDIPHLTLKKRLEAGWPLESALVADKKQQWTINNVKFLQLQPATKIEVINTLDAHFYPNNKKIKIVSNRVPVVIDGGTY